MSVSPWLAAAEATARHQAAALEAAAEAARLESANELSAIKVGRCRLTL